MALDAGLQLWGSEDLVQKRAEEAEGTLTGMLKFFQSRVQLEEKYAKSLGAITSKVKVEGGTIGSEWQSVRDQQNTHLSQSIVQSTSTVNLELVQPLDATRKKYGNDRSRLANDMTALKKEMQKRTSILNDKKNTYWARCEYHHKEKKKLEELMSGSQQSKIAKVQANYQKAIAEMEQSKKDYRDYIADYNDFKGKYEEAMRSFLNEYEAIDKERLNVISELLRKYLDHTEETCKQEQSYFTACREQLNGVSASNDITEYLNSVKDSVPPEVDQYEEYEPGTAKIAKESYGGDGASGEDGVPIQIGFCALPKFETPKTNLLVFARALYDFPGEADEELRFRKGDVLIVRQEHPSGWWVGELFGREGLFPACYVEIMKDRANLPKRWPPSGQRSCTARCSFAPTENNQLGFDDGEIVVINNECEGWYMGENNAGVLGMFPKDFVSLNETKSFSAKG